MPDFLSLLSSMDTVFKTGRDFVGFLSDVKSFLGKAEQAPNMMQMPQQGAAWQMPVMQPFQPQFHDPFGGGQQWLPQLQQMAGQNGNPWVPTQVHDLGGINLTGVWCPPMNPMDQTYIRQFGPYLNVIAGIGGMPTLYAEGLFNPAGAAIHLIGQYINGMPMEAQAQLLPNWMLQGVLASRNMFGMPMQMPIFMGKVA